MFSEPVLREKLVDVRDKNKVLFEAIEQLAEKYLQYSELLTPLLKSNEVTKNILGAWLLENLWIINNADRSYTWL